MTQAQIVFCCTSLARSKSCVFVAILVGLHMEQFIEVSRRELAWEVDYIREANCAKRFRYSMRVQCFTLQIELPYCL